jgi:hypothetical protein
MEDGRTRYLLFFIFVPGSSGLTMLSLYLRQEGAVLISMSNFNSAGKGSGWSNGVAFCPRLPGALAASGVYLPRERAERQKGQNEESGTSASDRWSRRLVPAAIFGFFTLGGLALFRRLVSAQGLGSESQPSFNPQMSSVATIGGLTVVSVIVAECGLESCTRFSTGLTQPTRDDTECLARSSRVESCCYYYANERDSRFLISSHDGVKKESLISAEAR